MLLIGERIITAEPERLWRILLDPVLLREAIPGCEVLEQTGINAFIATASVKVGPIKARFSGTVSLEDVVASKSCRIVGQGQGGIAGFVKGAALITTDPAGAGQARLAYSATVEIGGRIAALGDRLFHGVAQKNIDQFFDAVTLRCTGSAATTLQSA